MRSFVQEAEQHHVGLPTVSPPVLRGIVSFRSAFRMPLPPGVQGGLVQPLVSAPEWISQDIMLPLPTTTSPPPTPGKSG